MIKVGWDGEEGGKRICSGSRLVLKESARG